MSVMKVVQLGAKKAGQVLAKESPTILMGLGITGFVTTVVMAATAGSKASYLIDTEELYRRKRWSEQTGEDESSYPNSKTLTKMEKVKLTWKCYIPTAVMGATSIACIVGGNSINLRRNAALASIYSLTEATLKEYQEKVVEIIGKNKEEKVRDAIAQDKLDKNPVEDRQVILTGQGETLFYDSLSGRYFKSDIETVKKIENEFNKRLLSDMFLTVNELYDELGLEETDLGRKMGWSVERGLLDFKFSAKIASNGQPCIVLYYKTEPKEI